jgi:hypothetical protein
MLGKKDKEERQNRAKSGEKSRQFLETKHLNLKKLNLGSDLCTFLDMQTMEPKITHWKKQMPRILAKTTTTASARLTSHIAPD